MELDNYREMLRLQVFVSVLYKLNVFGTTNLVYHEDCLL
jgi:hypothetical protein